ncbi:four helix bundle protein [Flavobacterium sp.]|jgi:hypothetical protein|uniref:four helix bundle protein n=1 Tax=Flavobacterium sp. TaxID=239 RepID=UPI0037BFD768
MALHKDLPVYKLAYDLLSLATDLVRNMPRDFKASLGGRIRDECLNVLVLVGLANAAIDKTAHLTKLLEHLHVVELLLRLSHDKHFISNGQYARAVQVTDSVGAQVGGWRKVMAQRLAESAAPEPSQGSLFASPAALPVA